MRTIGQATVNLVGILAQEREKFLDSELAQCDAKAVRSAISAARDAVKQSRSLFTGIVKSAETATQNLLIQIVTQFKNLEGLAINRFSILGTIANSNPKISDPEVINEIQESFLSSLNNESLSVQLQLSTFVALTGLRKEALSIFATGLEEILKQKPEKFDIIPILKELTVKTAEIFTKATSPGNPGAEIIGPMLGSALAVAETFESSRKKRDDTNEYVLYFEELEEGLNGWMNAANHLL